MKDLICAMIKIGNYENVILLYVISNTLLSDLVYRAPQTQPIEDRKSSMNSQISFKSIGKGPVKKISFKSVMKKMSSIGKVLKGMPSIIFNSKHSSLANNEGRRDSGSSVGSKHSSLANNEGRRDSVGSKHSSLANNEGRRDSVGSKHSSLASNEGRRDSVGSKHLSLANNEGRRDSVGSKHSSLASNEGSISLPPTSPLSTQSGTGESRRPSTPSLSSEPTELSTCDPEYILLCHIHSYVKGQESLAIWNILRGNASEALLFIIDAIKIIEYSCGKTYKELKCIMYPRLFALKSLCQIGMEGNNDGDDSIIIEGQRQQERGGHECLALSVVWMAEAQKVC
jgi:hypothetical protein